MNTNTYSYDSFISSGKKDSSMQELVNNYLLHN